MEEKIIETLEKFQFTRTESLCYITLLKNGPLSGYQVAKNMGLSRSSVYSSLDNLLKKDAILLLPGDTNLYQAMDYKTFLSRLKDDYQANMTYLEDNLKTFDNVQATDKFYNIEGYDSVVNKIKEMILSAKEEIYINSDLSPLLFGNEIKEAYSRGVKTIYFSFCKIDIGDLPIDLYTHGHEGVPGKTYSRIMIAIDNSETLIASSSDGVVFHGTNTKHSLMTSIILEHIHHDIYLLRMRQKNPPVIIDDTVMIGSFFEKWMENFGF